MLSCGMWMHPNWFAGWSHMTPVWAPCHGTFTEAFSRVGSQRGAIHNYDPRMAQYSINNLQSHSLDVCGLKWSPNGRFLASGGNDNIVNIWDMYNKDPWTAPSRTLTEHTAAVKVRGSDVYSHAHCVLEIFWLLDWCDKVCINFLSL